MGNLDGRRFQDVYAIDLDDRRAQARGRSARAGSTARHPTANRCSITRTATTSSTRWRPARRATSRRARRSRSSTPKTTTTSSSRRRRSIGWASDSKSVLLSDNWDIWQVPVDGGPVREPDGQRPQGRDSLPAPLRARARRRTATTGIDLSKPQYFRAYGEWTKKAGIARLDPGKPGRADARRGGTRRYARLMKAKNADAVHLHARDVDSSRPTTTSPTRSSATATG